MARSPVRTALTAGALLASPAVTVPGILVLAAPGLADTLPDGSTPEVTRVDLLFLVALLLPTAGVAVLARGPSPRRERWASLAAACLAAVVAGLLVSSLVPAPLEYVGGWLALAGLTLVTLLGGGLLIGGAVAHLEGSTG